MVFDMRHHFAAVAAAALPFSSACWRRKFLRHRIRCRSRTPANPISRRGGDRGHEALLVHPYGDTRGRHDVELQAEHQLVIEAMLDTMKRATTSADSIRFVLQSGDAVVNGSFARQWSVSYVPLINRLTQEGGVPYFLSVGNHDVGNSTDLADARRVAGMRNYFAANAKLLPPKGCRAGSRAIPPTPSATATRTSSRSTRTSPTTRRSSPG